MRSILKIAAVAIGLAGAWLLGAASYRNLWFPLNTYRSAMGVGQPDLSYFDDVKRKIEVACPTSGPRTFSVLALGQSVGSNRAMRDEPPFVARSGALNFLDGKCYQAADPLLGGDGGGKGNSLWTIFADQVVASGTHDHAVVGLFTEGNTSMRDWVEHPGYIDRVAQLNAEMTKAGVAPDAISFMLGENDAFYGFPIRTTRDEFISRFRSFNSAIRKRGVTAPVYVAEETICSHPPYEPVASAQRSLADEAAGIRRGPNIDSIGFEHRWDGCHLTHEGRARAARLLREALVVHHQ